MLHELKGSFIKKSMILSLVFLFIFIDIAPVLATEGQKIIALPDDNVPTNIDSSLAGGGVNTLTGEGGIPFGYERQPVQNKLNIETDSITGAFVYTYPLSTSPGRNGLNPDLKLIYNNQDENNFNQFGFGWSINIPYIERINRIGIEKLYTENYYYSSLSGELKDIDLSDSSHGLYGSKVDNGEFLKYDFYTDNSWNVFDKKGTKYTFGLTSGSRQFDSASSSKIFKWMLEEVRDTNDNYIKYEYSKDNNQIYPYKIKYTGHDTTDGIFEIEFLRESRSDNAISTQPGFEVKTNYRINEVRSKINGIWANKYVLNYTVGDNGIRSVLNTITTSGQDEQSNVIALPVDDFDYQAKTKSWTDNNNWCIPAYFEYNGDQGIRLADVNGDGLADMVQGKAETGGNLRRVFINDGDSTGWTLDNNFSVPVNFVTSTGGDLGTRLADVNGDGFTDIIEAIHNTVSIRKVYINNGDSTGWTYDSNWDIPVDFIYDSLDNGVRLADVNGDGLVDLIEGRGEQGSNVRWVYLNDGDNTGWTRNDNWSQPINFVSTGADQGIRLADVNGDGLTDIIKGLDATKSVYINNGLGWTLNNNYIVPVSFYNNGDTGARLFDANGDGLVDIVSAYYYVGNNRAVYLNDGDGTGWSSNSGWTVPVNFVYNGADQGVQIADVNGDGLDDIVQSLQAGNKMDVYLADGEKADALSKVKSNKGAETNIIYQGSAEYLDSSNNQLNPELPLILQTLKSLSIDDGLGNIANTTYEYSGGNYYFNNSYDRKFSGFGRIAITDPVGFVTKNYYHQGNETSSSTGEFNDDISKIGKIYRSEILDNSNHLFSKTIDKWEKYDLGNGRNFVKLTQNIQFDFDGDTDHKDKASTYDYDNDYGNINEKVFWGEVSASDSGTFSDIGSDISSSSISYAASTTQNIVGLPAQEILSDQNGNKIRETKYYYDNLALGQVAKGNLTKEEKWKNGSSYIDTENIYNSYGLVTQTKDPRDKTTGYSYDSYNLYVATSTNPIGQNIVNEYDYSSGQVKNTKNPNGLYRETVYDALDRIKDEKQPDLTTPSSLVIKTSYSYTDTSFPRKITRTDNLDGTNNFVTYTYFDGLDRKIQEKKEAETASGYSVKDYVYNKNGMLEKESLPYFSSGTAYSPATSNNMLYSSYGYDPLGRITSITDSLGTVTNTYDDWKVTTSDKEGKVKSLYNDAYNKLVQVDENNSTSVYSTLYEYDLAGELTKITDALDNVRNFTYDGLGRMLTSEDLHESSDEYFGTWLYEYDDADNLISKQDPNEQTTNYAYDDINRVLSENFTAQDGTEVVYGYDNCVYGAGLLCSATSTESSISLNYNPTGLVDEENKNINSTIHQTEYVYDRQGNVVSIAYPDNSEVRYTYNSAGQLDKVEQKENGGSFAEVVNNLDYNPNGQIILEKFNNNTESYYTYNPNELYRLANKTTLSSTVGEGEQMRMLSAENSSMNSLSQEILLSSGQAYKKTDGSIAIYNPIEITSLRTENSNSYLTGYSASGESQYTGKFYSGHVNYLNKVTNNFELIDTKLSDGVDKWIMDKAPYSAKIKKTFGENFITFNNNGQELFFSVPGLTATIQGKKEILINDWTDKRVIYENALKKGIDIRVSLDNESLVKEVIINNLRSLGKISSQTYYEIPFKLISNKQIDIKVGEKLLSVKKNIITNNEVEIIDDQGVTSYIRAPKIEDAQGNEIGIDIEYSIKSDGIYLTKKLPVDWLNKAVYPVVTDAVVSYYGSVGDGNIETQPSPGSWSTQHADTTGQGVNYTSDKFSPNVSVYNSSNGSLMIRRAFLPIDTSGLPDNSSVYGATLKLYVKGKDDDFNNSYGYIRVVQSDQSSVSSLVNADINNCGSVTDPTAGADDIDITGITLNQYLSVSLNASGRSWVSKTGYTKFGFREGHDVQNVSPTWTGNTWKQEGVDISSYEEVGTNKDPYIEITYGYNGSPTAPTSLQTEGQSNPSKVEDTTPEFNAIYNDPDAGDIASYYRIQVSTSTSFTNLTWDSNKTALASQLVNGNRSSDISYGGSALALNGTKYYWRIKFWDDEDAEGSWSSGNDYFLMSANALYYSNCLSAQAGEISPQGLECGAPVFSAVYQSASGKPANKYQIQVNTQSNFLGTTLWDSGSSGTSLGEVQNGSRSWDIVYRGNPLSFATSTYYWRIKFWDKDGTAGDWSTVSSNNSFSTVNANVLQDLHYTYDKSGNIKTIKDNSDTNTEKIVNFNYDDLYRLTVASTTNAINGQNYRQTYSYNAIGNISNKSDIGNYSYTGNQGTSYANPHAATVVNNQTQVYDNNGNLIDDGTWSHVWDYNNRLIQSTNGSATSTYVYDYAGDRVSKTSGTSTTYYINQYYEIDNGVPIKHIFAGSNSVATARGTSTPEITFTHTDHLIGSNVETDSGGNVIEVIDYYPFGSTRLDEKSGSTDNHYKFTGKELDQETSLYYYGARYYNSDKGRFTTLDPLTNDIGISAEQFKQKYGKDVNEILSDPQGLNSYSYVKNNPLRYTDPTGAYGVDVHLDLTYYLARMSGLSVRQSVGVSSANQDVDNNLSTTPTYGENIFNGNTNSYHFGSRLDTMIAMKGVLNSGNSDSNSMISQYGSLLHTFQDSYSHGNLNIFSHAWESTMGIDPDITYQNSKKAMEMSRATFSLLRRLNATSNGTGGLSLKNYNSETQKLWNEISSGVQTYINSQDKSKTDIKKQTSIIK